MCGEKIKELQSKIEKLVLDYSFLIAVAIIAWGFCSTNLPPIIVFGLVTALFAYLTYKFSKEKFRLDLFEKRWEVYQNTLEFCSVVSMQGTLQLRKDNEKEIEAALRAAANSFRGIGYHKTQFLFGEEVYKLFEQLNEAYSCLISFPELNEIQNQKERMKWVEDGHSSVECAWKTTQKLPDIFKPYIYFGDYKR